MGKNKSPVESLFCKVWQQTLVHPKGEKTQTKISYLGILRKKVKQLTEREVGSKTVVTGYVKCIWLYFLDTKLQYCSPNNKNKHSRILQSLTGQQSVVRKTKKSWLTQDDDNFFYTIKETNTH